ncbi:MAG: hypothetical protein QOI47_732 [Actinomycetota bacterium]|nr:hypothetical protein [Actinomycetota bacterium]
MESRARHRALALLVAIITAIGLPSAYARDPGTNVKGETDQNGVEVVITAEDEASHQVPAGHTTSTCHWTATLTSSWTYTDQQPIYGPAPSPEHHLYHVYCDGEYVGTYWLGPRNLAAAPDTAAMAGQVVEDVPVDLAAIGSRPTGKAVTGIPSYFWVDGYRGAPINQTVTGLGVSVEVSITLGSVVWDFGDGTPPVLGGLGEPWPARSSIHHTYRDRGVKTVTVTITLPAGFRVNGGQVQALPPVVRTATLSYRVDEVQAVRDK